MKPAIPIDSLSEKEWDYQLFNAKVGLARMTGWSLVYHTYRPRNSPAGFPDDVLVRERVVFAELKTEDKASKPSAWQIIWLDGLATAGAEVYLWRPRDLEEIGQILGPRWGFLGWTKDRPPQLMHYERGVWTPKSAWIPGVGRAELLGEAV